MDIKINFSDLERAVNDAVTEGTRNILQQHEVAARSVVCSLHGQQCWMDISDYNLPTMANAHYCCDEGKRLLMEAIGATET